QREKRRRANHPAGDGVVVADDRVLNGVRQRQEHDEVKRVELRQLALAGEPQSDDQKEIDQDRPNHLLGDGNAQREQVTPHFLIGRRIKRAGRNDWKVVHRSFLLAAIYFGHWMFAGHFWLPIVREDGRKEVRRTKDEGVARGLGLVGFVF